jgi:hypothetical protein
VDYYEQHISGNTKEAVKQNAAALMSNLHAEDRREPSSAYQVKKALNTPPSRVHVVFDSDLESVTEINLENECD